MTTPTTDFPQNSPNYFEHEYRDYNSSHIKNFVQHLQSMDHKNNADNGISPKKPRTIYSCAACDYTTCNKKDYTIHNSTRKHLNNTNSPNPPEKNPNEYKCPNCNKAHKDRAGLWRHKKKCSLNEEPNELKTKMNSNIITTELVIELVKQNKELQELLRDERKILIEEMKKSNNGSNNVYANTISNNTNIQNTNNNSNFNLNVFLNEQCKNAINLSDFINSLVVTAQDFERTGKVGFVEGISKIFLKGLKALDVYSRPIHCTDLKRESIYVKQDNVWVKEDSEKTHLNTAVKQLARKNLRQLVTWKEENPDCLDTSTPASDLLVKFSQTALGGIGEQEDAKYRNAIIKNIMKDVVVDKA
jgi:hypothetical protein